MAVPMPNPSMTWPISLLYGSLRIVGALPLRFVLACGATFGLLAWHLRGRSRRIAEHNLSLLITQERGENRQHLAKKCVID